eukprot:4759835-Pyramimonas_sp.AAC.1
MPLKMFGETEWVTYKEVGDTSMAFGAGLLKLGMVPLKDGADFEKSSGGSTLMIYEVCTHSPPSIPNRDNLQSRHRCNERPLQRANRGNTPRPYDPIRSIRFVWQPFAVRTEQTI